MVVRTVPPSPTPAASEAGESVNGESDNGEYTAQDVAALESQLLYRDADIPKWRFVFLCAGVSLGLFLAMIDSSIVATSLFTIAARLGEPDRINWVALAYTLAFVGCSVFFARLADIIGRRDAYILAFLLFFTFSIGCGAAMNLTTLLVCRAFQGIGGSGLFSVTMIILSEVPPERFRMSIAPVIGLVISMAGVLGPVLGGAFTSVNDWGWRMIFLINVPLGFVSMIIFFFSWPKPQYLPATERRPWKDLDLIGSFLVIAAAVLVTFAFQNAGIAHGTANPWSQAVFIGPLVAGILCWIVVFAWERHFEHASSSKMAAIPLVLYRNQVFTCTTLSTIFLGFAFLATLFAVPLRLQVVNQQTSVMAGVWMLPMLAATGIGSMFTGALNKNANRLAETMIVGTILVTIGLALETSVSDTERVESKFIGILVLVGLGYGMITSSATVFTTMEAPMNEHAPAQGMIAQARMLGGSIGIAMTAAILATQQRNALLNTGIITSAQFSSLPGNLETLTETQQAAVRSAYNGAFTETMKICAIVAGIGVMISMGTFRRSRKTLTTQRYQQVQDEMARRQREIQRKEPASSPSSESDRSA